MNRSRFVVDKTWRCRHSIRHLSAQQQLFLIRPTIRTLRVGYHHHHHHHHRRHYIKASFSVTHESIDHPLSKHIQTCLFENHPEQLLLDHDFTVFFLGTSGHIPTTSRNTSATVLRLASPHQRATSSTRTDTAAARSNSRSNSSSQVFLFDAGEGIQHQLMKSRIQLKHLTKIFITHMHGDHLYGLPGLLLHLHSVTYGREQQQQQQQHAVELYGPPGLFNYVAMNMALSSVASTVGSIVVHELIGGDADPGYDPSTRRNPKPQSQSPQQRDARHATYREVWRRNLTRHTIPRNDDGTWTISSPKHTDGELIIQAAEVHHVKGVQTFGYMVQEPTPQPNIDVAKATALGLRPSRKYKLLKEGHTVESDDGTTMIHPSQVMVDESKQRRQRARKFALVGDNYELSHAMKTLCHRTDVLVHEATMINTTTSVQQCRKRGHSSPEMAGRVAQDVQARVLVLNHLSPKVRTADDEASLMQRASLQNDSNDTNDEDGNSYDDDEHDDDDNDDDNGNETTSKKDSNTTPTVIVAHDFMELIVPYNGF